MKKKKGERMFFIVMLLGIFLVNNMTLANAKEYAMEHMTYTVSKGDSLSLIGQKFNLNWQEIADLNGISEPYLIYPGDILTINKPVKEKSCTYTVVSGDSLSLIGQKFKMDWQEIANLNGISEPYLIYPGNVLCLCRIETKKVGITPVSINPTPKKTVKRTVKPVIKLKEKHLKTSKKSFLPEGKVVPAKDGLSSFGDLSQRETGISLLTGMDMLEIYSYGGYSEKIHKDANGSYVGVKVKARPIAIHHHGIKQEFGMFIVGEQNDGRSGDYKYHNDKVVIGLTTGIETENYDFSFDVGLGKKKGRGSSGLYKSHQDDDIFYLSTYFESEKRRREGEVWLPQYNLGFWTNIPFNADKDSSWDGKKLDQKPWDGQSYELSFRQDIYDVKFNNWTVTPLVKFSYGHSWGDDASNYGILPGLKLSYKQYDLLSLSAFGYTEELGGDNDKIKWLGLFVDVGNVVRAIKSSRISEYKPKK